MSARRRKAELSPNNPNFALDTVSEKKRRGPEQRVIPRIVRGNADNRRVALANVWPRFWPALEQAITEADVRAAIDLTQPYQDYFALQAELILRGFKDPDFPTIQRGRI